MTDLAQAIDRLIAGKAMVYDGLILVEVYAHMHDKPWLCTAVSTTRRMMHRADIAWLIERLQDLEP